MESGKQTVTLTEANFASEVLESPRPVLVDFLGRVVCTLPAGCPGHRRAGPQVRGPSDGREAERR